MWIASVASRGVETFPLSVTTPLLVSTSMLCAAVSGSAARRVFTDAETIRFTVKLTVQEPSGKPEERRVTYAVALKSPVVVCRDPYF